MNKQVRETKAGGEALCASGARCSVSSNNKEKWRRKKKGIELFLRDAIRAGSIPTPGNREPNLFLPILAMVS